VVTRYSSDGYGFSASIVQGEGTAGIPAKDLAVELSVSSMYGGLESSQ